MPEQQALLAELASVRDIFTGDPLVDTKRLVGLEVHAHNARLQLKVPYAAQSLQPQWQTQLQEAARRAGVAQLEVTFVQEVLAHAVQPGVQVQPQVRNVIAVASGKGGVGKSTTAVNLALALRQEGARVGILDADIYGPSLPAMLGLQQRPESRDGKSMEPLEAHGLQAMSIGFLIKKDDAMIWRGPMAVQAMEQMFRQTNWRDLDYLVIDLPPGTGDIHLSLSQKLPVTGAVIVTTPQDIALLDARKGIRMFEKVKVPILGLVENMAVHVCSQCGHAEHIFGEGGGKALSADVGVAYLGALPLDVQIRLQADGGTPIVASAPDGAVAQTYRDIAHRVGARLSQFPKDYSHKFGNIAVSQSS
ncbi:ATP-binding protein [Lampropedia cohaerens]|uniref:Iron-sulfur cluster carrier protein n=1 Tax=Lampropedia cohaerens TaxID=1610491 RepID=A0A0U1Q0N9_9BURK|nr:iron-sulfur cluster carrier protein ApbC [Lampropedia cohaerens]KKW68328.1 ATP-binding protein [Lampropedia cohaerens]